MAILKSGKAIAEIKFVDYNYGYVSYSLRLLYGDKPIINPELLAEDPIHFDEYDKDYLIPFFENLLKEDKNAVFNPLEPEMRIEAYFYPKFGLKEADVLKEKGGYWYSEDYKKKLRDVDEERDRAGGRLPDDGFDIYFWANDQKLKPWHDEVGAYGGFVFGMNVEVSRSELQNFVSELKKEYQEWKEKNKEQIEHYGGKEKLQDYVVE